MASRHGSCLRNLQCDHGRISFSTGPWLPLARKYLVSASDKNSSHSACVSAPSARLLRQNSSAQSSSLSMSELGDMSSLPCSSLQACGEPVSVSSLHESELMTSIPPVVVYHVHDHARCIVLVPPGDVDRDRCTPHASRGLLHRARCYRRMAICCCPGRPNHYRAALLRRWRDCRAC